MILEMMVHPVGEGVAGQSSWYYGGQGERQEVPKDLVPQEPALSELFSLVMPHLLKFLQPSRGVPPAGDQEFTVSHNNNWP